MFMDGKTYVIKMAVLPKLIYRVSTSPIKLFSFYFIEADKLIVNFMGNATDIK